jgi:hypothetical protein
VQKVRKDKCGREEKRSEEGKGRELQKEGEENAERKGAEVQKVREEKCRREWKGREVQK